MQEKRNDDALDQALSRLYSDRTPPAFETAWRAAVRREESIQMTNKPSKNRFWRAALPALAACVLVVGSLWAGNHTFRPVQEIAPSAEQSAASTAYRATGPSIAGNGKMATSRSMDVSASDDLAFESYSFGASDSGASDGFASNSSSSSTTASTDGSATQQQAKLVRTASVTVHTTAYESDLNSLNALLAQLGGYVENLYEYGDAESGGTRTSDLSMRVPADQLDAFLAGVEGIGRVVDRSESSTDMTVQYADNEARLATLRSKMTRLNELLAQAQNVSDLIEIENAIADTQYQIDSYETSQRNIDRRVDMSAVHVTLVEETPAQSASSKDMSLGERIAAAFHASLNGLGHFFRNMLVFIVMALPVLIPVCIIGVIVWLCVRRRRIKRMAEPSDGSKEE